MRGKSTAPVHGPPDVDDPRSTVVSPSDAAVLLAASTVAGAINSIAGGGSLIVPALVWLGREPIRANATKTVSLSPGSDRQTPCS
jgi:hypothetical protein